MNLRTISIQPGTTNAQIATAWRMARESVDRILDETDGHIPAWEVIDAVVEPCSINGLDIDDKTALRFARRVYAERCS